MWQPRCWSWVLGETPGSHYSPPGSLHSAIPPTPEWGILAAALRTLLQLTLTRSSSRRWLQWDMSSAASLVGKTLRQPLCFLPPPAIHLVGDAATLQLYLGSLKGSLADTHTVWEQSAEESCKSRRPHLVGHISCFKLVSFQRWKLTARNCPALNILLHVRGGERATSSQGPHNPHECPQGLCLV